MRGVFPIKKDHYLAKIKQPEATLSLIANAGGIDFMIQEVYADRPCCISPGDDQELIEFFYILEGMIILSTDSGDQVLTQGESFYVQGLVNNLPVKTPHGAKLLYIASKPVFRYLYGFIGDLNELLKQTEQKDLYTHNHGNRVEKYSVKICEELGLSKEIINSLAISSLFHDVGKCFIPDSILNKPGKLTDEEFKIIMKHPIDSRRLLENKFKGNVALIAEQHHERVNGSGYPYGLKEDEILLEAKIIAVADSFDAMTSNRSYRSAMPTKAALHELKSLAGIHYDRDVIVALEKVLVNEKKLA